MNGSTYRMQSSYFVRNEVSRNSQGCLGVLENDVYIYTILLLVRGARGSVLGWGTMLQAGRSPVRVPDEVDFFNLPNPSSRTMALGSTQPLTGMSTRNLPGGKKRLTTLPPHVCRMSENVGASTCRIPKGLHGLYRYNFTFYLMLVKYLWTARISCNWNTDGSCWSEARRNLIWETAGNMKEGHRKLVRRNCTQRGQIRGDSNSTGCGIYQTSSTNWISLSRTSRLRPKCFMFRESKCDDRDHMLVWLQIYSGLFPVLTYSAFVFLFYWHVFDVCVTPEQSPSWQANSRSGSQ
jgi:hypothetical protein